jgi:hypothetical protein
MRTFVKLGVAGVVVASVTLLLFQPTPVQAHPRLMGPWKSVSPANINKAYVFEPGVYVGDGIWRGPCTLYVEDMYIGCGSWELRMREGTQGTLSIRDGINQGFVHVGMVDLGTREVILKGVLYRPQ